MIRQLVSVMQQMLLTSLGYVPLVSSLKCCIFVLYGHLFHSWYLQGNKKTIILREIPEDGVKKFLSNKESLATCDVAVFVYDR